MGYYTIEINLVLVVTGGKQSQLLFQPIKVELGLQVGVEFDKSLKFKVTNVPTRTL